MSKPSHAKGKPHRRGSDDHQEGPPWDDEKLDQQQQTRSMGIYANRADRRSTRAAPRPDRRNPSPGASASDRAALDTIVATQEAQTFIIRDILRALVREALVDEEMVIKILAGAAMSAKNAGHCAAAKEVRRMRKLAFPD
jgi:hypothetical protein